MPDNIPNLDDLARQAAQHIDSLRAAGVDWLPNEPLPEPKAAPTATVSLPVTEPAGVQTSLFAGTATPAAELTVEQRKQELDALAQRVAVCTRCSELASRRTQTVFGVGPLDPELCFIGEAPGADEDRIGEPFVGAAGQLLTRIITACGMKREEVFICNILRCRPPNNRQPTPDEAHHCKEYLERTLELVRPKFICALGGTAVTHLLGTTAGITKLRGKFFQYQGIPVLCTFHPSYLLRSPEKKKDVWEDMKTLLTRMGRPIPGKSG
jgi:uracil-DNA glycosylase family 4